MKEIKLTQNKVVLVDDEDYEYLNQWKWYADTNKKTNYASRKIVLDGIKTSIRMHTVIMKTPIGLTVDHINHNGLDNRKENLRVCTQEQNSKNRLKVNGKSKYLGVSPSNRISKPWRAFGKISKKSISIGYFKTQEEAAIAYNNFAKQNYKEYANLNKIEPLIAL
jgi:hypothetical protein